MKRIQTVIVAFAETDEEALSFVSDISSLVEELKTEKNLAHVVSSDVISLKEEA